VSVNRDVGTVTVMSVDYADGQPKMTVTAEINVCAAAGDTSCEPWEVAIDGCGTTAYVVTRKDQRVTQIVNLASNPAKGVSAAVGSEPTAVAITPNNTAIYVANWVDGTLTALEPTKLGVTGTVDLNATLAATGALGPEVKNSPRASLAHPRALAITNNGDASDSDEKIIVTEWSALRTAPETIATADTNWKGAVYKVAVGSSTASIIDLPAVTDTGFNDHNNAVTGCFPNQVASVTIDGGTAWVTSTCASPKGPSGVFQKGACTGNAACQAANPASTCSAGVCTLTCVVDADCGFGAAAGSCVLPAGTCKPNANDVKTSTHGGVSIVDINGDTATTQTIDTLFVAKGSSRLPLLPTDIGFVNNFAYVTAEGADAVFRLITGPGQITGVGSANNNFINLRKDAADKLIRLPIGIATAHNKAAGFVANDGSRDVTALSFAAQAIAGDQMADFRITQASKLPDPAADPAAASALAGKRFFNTGLGRWSLQGAGWGSCGACHIDGLSDGVTWYFGRGPRQTISLDGDFASKDPTDQRVLNWTAIFDEIADFELNTRGVSGGLGALVTADPNNPMAELRINLGTETPPQQGLQGATAEIGNPSGGAPHPHSVHADWIDIENWVKTIRSPRRPTNLVAADVTAGKALFSDPLQGNCAGCHSGAKWTISRRFYTPADGTNPADGVSTAPSLEGVDWSVTAKAAGFPAALFPVTDIANARERFGVFPGTEQIQCILRPVGTIAKDPNNAAAALGISSPEIGVLELRQDMKTAGQGAFDTGRGFNPPSLLGMQVGAPYFHAGNARSLEEVFNDALFAGHHRSAIAQVFTPDATKTRQLVAYVLSLDEDEATLPIPALSSAGGDFCK
jgi:hypothetical protein